MSCLPRLTINVSCGFPLVLDTCFALSNSKGGGGGGGGNSHVQMQFQCCDTAHAATFHHENTAVIYNTHPAS